MKRKRTKHVENTAGFKLKLDTDISHCLSEIIHSPATGSCGTIGFVAENKLMKRTRATVRIQQGNKTEEDDNEEDMVTKSQASVCLYFKQ